MKDAPSHKPAVLIIDDEVQIRRLLRVTFEANGYRVYEASTGHDGIVEAAQRKPEVVVLDLGLPDLDGLTVLKRLREWSRAPVVVLTVRDADDEKVALLDAGADDYVTKPFSTPELLARVRVALRHAQPLPENAVFRAGDVEVDLSTRRVALHGQEIKLTPIEYSFLSLLVQHAGRVVTQRQILTEVWGPNAAEQTHYLRVYAAHLRDKLEKDPSHPQLILTEPGVGYRFAASP
jgi:two-component system, OmpR family, KDP operon response regulator KdpE